MVTAIQAELLVTKVDTKAPMAVKLREIKAEQEGAAVDSGAALLETIRAKMAAVAVAVAVDLVMERQ
jgi:hypothetical protein